MIDRRIAKFKLRRGTDAQRQTVVFDEGELVYVTDTQRVYIGTGETTLSGGIPVASVVKYTKNRPPITHVPGDLYYQENLGKMFIYNDENYSTFVGPYADNSTIVFDASGRLAIAEGGISTIHLNTSALGASSGIGIDMSGFYINYDPTTLYIDGSNRLAVMTGSTAVDPVGGIKLNPLGVAVDVDATTMIVSSGKVKVGTIDTANIATGAVDVSKLSTSVVNATGGLSINPGGLSVLCDNQTIKLSGGVLVANISAISTSITVLSVVDTTTGANNSVESLKTPAGTIIYTARKTPPPGYLACDGSRVSLATYPGLSAIYVGDTDNLNNASMQFGKKYAASTGGSPNNSGEYISLPDLRGIFARGWGGSEGSYDTGRVFGSLQTSRFAAHTHFVDGRTLAYKSDDGIGTFYATFDDKTKFCAAGRQASSTYVNRSSYTSSSFTLETQSTGSTETRPVNLALLACIKT